MRVAGRAEARVLGGAAHAELVHVQRADADGAGRFELAHDRGVVSRNRVVCMQRGAGAGGQAGDVDHCLDAERHAGKRTGLHPGAMRVVERGRSGPGAVRGHRGECIDHRIERGDARQCGFQHRCRGNLTRLHRGGDGSRRCVGAQCVAHDDESSLSGRAASVGAGRESRSLRRPSRADARGSRRRRRGTPRECVQRAAAASR
jgi:hypothetical protein